MISLETASPKTLFLRPGCTVLERIGGMCVNDTPNTHVLTSAYANLMLLFIGGKERWFVYTYV